MEALFSWRFVRELGASRSRSLAETGYPSNCIGRHQRGGGDRVDIMEDNTKAALQQILLGVRHNRAPCSRWVLEPEDVILLERVFALEKCPGRELRQQPDLG